MKIQIKYEYNMFLMTLCLSINRYMCNVSVTNNWGYNLTVNHSDKMSVYLSPTDTVF